MSRKERGVTGGGAPDVPAPLMPLYRARARRNGGAAFWLAFNTVAAPVVIQKVVSYGALARATEAPSEGSRTEVQRGAGFNLANEMANNRW